MPSAFFTSQILEGRMDLQQKEQRPVRIDFHTHPTLIKEYVQNDEKLLTASREVFDIQNNLQPIETFHLQMDAARIDKAVLLPIDCQDTQGVSIFSNEQIAEIVRKDQRFIGFASVNPMNTNAAQTLENAVSNLGLRGLKLAPELQYFNPNDKHHAYPVYEKAQSLGIPIVFHTGFSWEPQAHHVYSNPLLLEPVALTFPELKMVLAHLGWPWHQQAALMAIKHPNVYLDTSALYFGNPQEFFSFLFGTQLPTVILEGSLRNKVVFGSNYPRIEIHKMVEALEALGLSNTTLDHIFATNASTILGKEIL